MPEVSSTPPILIGPSDFLLEDAFNILRAPFRHLELDAVVLQRVARAHDVVSSVLRSKKSVYGINTGFGKLARVSIDQDHIEELQLNLVRSHASGLGSPIPIPETRLAMALRIVSLGAGHSGVRTELIEWLVAAYNHGLTPLVPSQGSVGASGDLAPLAHIALSWIGEGKVRIGEDPAIVPSKVALQRFGLEPLRLSAKEGLALINGTQVSTALAVSALRMARFALKVADLCVATTLEATKGTVTPFDSRFYNARPHPGALQVSQNICKLLEGSEILSSHRNCDKVQDPYSVRCAPQVHGAVRDAVAYASKTIDIEIRSVTDNPLVFPDQNEILSGGNFHGQPIGLVCDHLAAALTTLSGISERRIDQMVNPDLSGLPAFLIEDSGLHSGFMIAQVAAAAILSENKTLAHPASVDSIPTSANQEDHVSMSTWAARKCGKVVDRVLKVLSIELLAACQGLEFETELRAGRGVEATRAVIREQIPPLDRDRVLSTDIETVLDLILSGTLHRRVEKIVGELQ